MSHFRNLLVCKDETTLKLVEAGSAIRDKYREQTLKCPVNFLYKGLEILSSADIYYKTSRNQKLHVELALIRLATHNIDTGQTTSNEILQKEKQNKEVLDNRKENRPEIKTDNKSYEQVSRLKKEDTAPKSFSIKERLNKQQNDKDPENIDESKDEYGMDDEPDNNQEFGQEELMEAWRSFGDTVRSGNPRMSSIIKAMKPVIEDETNIILELSNKAQKDYFDQKYKLEIINHLKKELSNSKIQFRTRVSEVTGKATPYTEEEKYRHLADKNPALDKLRNELGLEYD
jgi:DNA polymerase-3 subunit gamma/tau